MSESPGLMTTGDMALISIVKCDIEKRDAYAERGVIRDLLNASSGERNHKNKS
jgi:hypothetical protein